MSTLNPPSFSLLQFSIPCLVVSILFRVQVQASLYILLPVLDSGPNITIAPFWHINAVLFLFLSFLCIFLYPRPSPFLVLYRLLKRSVAAPHSNRTDDDDDRLPKASRRLPSSSSSSSLSSHPQSPPRLFSLSLSLPTLFLSFFPFSLLLFLVLFLFDLIFVCLLFSHGGLCRISPVTPVGSFPPRPFIPSISPSPELRQ